MGEMVITTKKHCKGCKYGIYISTETIACNYLVMTNKLRDCEIGFCDKFEPKKRTRKKRETDGAERSKKNNK